MSFSEKISARQTGVKVAGMAMQATLSKFDEVEDVDDVVKKILEIADEKIVPYILNGKGGAVPSQTEDTMLYVTVSKKDKDPSEYAEAFKKYDFVQGTKGGYWANIPSSKLVQMFREYNGIDRKLKFTFQLSKRTQK